jgi:hypothetical protein
LRVVREHALDGHRSAEHADMQRPAFGANSAPHCAIAFDRDAVGSTPTVTVGVMRGHHDHRCPGRART